MDDPLKEFVGSLNQAQTISGALMTEELRNDPDALFNPKRPAVDLKHEKAEHRVIILLKAQGFSNIEIARELGFTPVMVNYVVNQPWAQKRIVEEIQRVGRDEVGTLLRSTVIDRIHKIIEIADNPETKEATALEANKYLIDRVLGKPRQAIDHNLEGKLPELTDEELAQIATGLNTITASAR